MSFSAKSPRLCDARRSSLFCCLLSPSRLSCSLYHQAKSLFCCLLSAEPPQLFVRPPGKASVADYESWDIAVLLFTMARSPVADHKVAQPELDVGPCHDCISPKTTPKDKTAVTYGRTGGLKKGPARAFIRRQAIFPPLFFNLVRRWGRHLSACVLDGPRRHCLEALRLSSAFPGSDHRRSKSEFFVCGQTLDPSRWSTLLGRFHRNDTRWG